jgi:phosphatidate cytidylyltransferase
MFIWIYDTGAYLTGMTFGRHKLFERVSPKKSWEGVYGGILFCILLGWGLSYDTFWNFIHINVHDGIRLSTLEWIGMGVVVAIFSTFGDLIESFVKRSVGVKDSGTILPGHGGLWDRFDSLLMATPALVIYLNVIKLL